jgi:hypothetical protein
MPTALCHNSEDRLIMWADTSKTSEKKFVKLSYMNIGISIADATVV